MKKQSEIEVLIRRYATFRSRRDNYELNGKDGLACEMDESANKIFDQITSALNELYNATVQA